jgi:hypothetical protein
VLAHEEFRRVGSQITQAQRNELVSYKQG